LWRVERLRLDGEVCRWTVGTGWVVGRRWGGRGGDETRNYEW